MDNQSEQGEIETKALEKGEAKETLTQVVQEYMIKLGERCDRRITNYEKRVAEFESYAKRYEALVPKDGASTTDDIIAQLFHTDILMFRMSIGSALDTSFLAILVGSLAKTVEAIAAKANALEVLKGELKSYATLMAKIQEALKKKENETDRFTEAANTIWNNLIKRGVVA